MRNGCDNTFGGAAAVKCRLTPIDDVMLAAKPYLRALKINPSREIDFDAYPFCIPAVRAIERLDFHPDVTFLVGENGAGKSTLMEAMAVAWGFNAEGG